MSDQPSRRLFGRQRRENADVPRDRRYTVKVNAEEDARLRARAVVAGGITVPRLLFEAAMNAHVETSVERKQLIAELFSLRRTMAGVANNVNQLARYANEEGTFPAEAVAVVGEYRATVRRMNVLIEELARG